MSRSAWFDGPLPRILAHRGLALAVPQNSIAAFEAAIAAGATHVETDARVTRDGHAVLVHDPVAASGQPAVASLSLAELQQRSPWVATLADALAALPQARFNIDVKTIAAAQPVAHAVRMAHAIDRVLVTSFSERRRRVVIEPLPGVATSASASRTARALLAARLGRSANRPLRPVDALQIPVRGFGMDLTAPALLDAWHAAGVEVHYWVIDDPEQMRALVARGADGIVTDRTDLAVTALR